MDDINKPLRVLKLTLEKKWFDLILSGGKKEEYREIKFYWVWRLTIDKELVKRENQYISKLKEYDRVEFVNGYKRNSPRVVMECKGLEIGKGREDWGAIPNEEYFVIKLGRELWRWGCDE